MMKVIAENVFPPYAGKVPFFLKATSFSHYRMNVDIPTTDVEEALRLGADGISVDVIVGGPEKDPDAVAYAVRAAAELGVDIIKTNCTVHRKPLQKLYNVVQQGLLLQMAYPETTWIII